MSEPNTMWADGVAGIFLRELFSDKPDSLKVVLWQLQNRKHSHFPNLDAAASTALLRDDIYSAVSLYGDTKRGNDTARGIPGLWLDVDSQIDGVKPYGATLGRLAAFCELLPEPTMVVNSGHGQHLWWLFTDLWVFRDVSDRSLAARLCDSWMRMATHYAQSVGIELDNVSDLARILRLPGTWNTKYGDRVPVTLVSHGGPRYTVASLRSLVDEWWNVAQAPSATAAKVTAQDDPLLDIPAVEYVEALTGLVPDRSGKVSCPFHEDSHPSMHLYPAVRGFTCFQCKRKGGIYQFAGHLWGYLPEARYDRETKQWAQVKLRDVAFLNVQDRLLEVMGDYYQKRTAA